MGDRLNQFFKEQLDRDARHCIAMSYDDTMIFDLATRGVNEPHLQKLHYLEMKRKIEELKDGVK